MSEAEEIRTSVSEAYTAAVRATKKSGCCGTSRTSTVTKLAGYDATALADLPTDAVESSFGCGDPTAFADVEAGQVVLDLGSGAGIDLLLAARKVGSAGKVIGVDMTDEMIARARANAARAGLDAIIEVRKGIIEELPVDDASVDWVISNCVINLSPEKDRVFAEIARVLKPGGRMAVSDIVVDGIPEWMREAVDVYSACIGGAISERDYLAGLEQAGLTDVAVAGRFVYDASQLKAMIETDGEQLSGCCGGGGIPAGLINEAIDEITGRIASARIVGRKPG